MTWQVGMIERTIRDVATSSKQPICNPRWSHYWRAMSWAEGLQGRNSRSGKPTSIGSCYHPQL
jgi:hypothetical protein